MATSLNSMLTYARVVLNDTDSSMYQYEDTDLINSLKVAFLLQEASWNQSYTMALNGTTGEYEISPTVPDWYQILICLKMCISCKLFEERYSFDNKVTKVTNSTKSDDIKQLIKIYEEIIQERRYGTVVGYAYNSWDDFFTRPNLIYNEILQGYR